jgi:Ca2+-binding EF-hand superfamily protein
MMKRTHCLTAFATAALTMAALEVAPAQVAPGTTTQPAPVAVQAPTTTPVQASPSAGASQLMERKPGDVPGPIDSVQDVQDTLKMAFMAADQNHDGQLSQQEAIDAGNTLIGGLFFAADADGDGKVTQQEAQAVRQKVMQQNPLLRVVAQRARHSTVDGGNQAGGAQAAAGIASLLDTNNDRAFSAAEVRQMVQSLVQATFATADTNRDGQLSPTELNAAAYGAARAGVQAAFQTADADNNSALSKEEFTRALANPVNSAFDILDANLDGQLTLEEINNATRVLATQFRAMKIPQARNSATQLIEQGNRPSQVAPVPNIQVPAAATTRPPGQ